MSRILRVLHVENSESDMALLTRHLSRAGYDLVSERVETAAAMKAALESQEWDVILCDYSMPHFNGLSALALLKEMRLDIPFIVISGTVGEAAAVEAMRAGAHDYLMKDNLLRLAPTIERELHEAENHRACSQAEQQLLVTQQLLQQVLASSPAVIYSRKFDRNESCPSWLSDNIVWILGYDVQEALDPSWWRERIHPEDLAKVLDGEAELFQNNHLVRDYRFRHKDGTYRWVQDEQRLLRNDRAEPVGIVGAWIDISKRKLAEEALVETNETLESIIQASPLAIIGKDADGNVKTWNWAAERIFGWSAEEVVGRPYGLVPAGRENEIEEGLEVMRDGGNLTGLETKRRRKDGELIDVSISASALRNGRGDFNGVVTVIADITERIHLEEQLRQSQKMEAIGRLAGGVAHDFNNLLTAIIGYSQMALTRLQDDDPLRKDIEEVEKAGIRAAALTGQLLAFSRRQVVQLRTLNLNVVVAELSKLLHRVIGEDVALETSLDPAIGLVKADSGQIEQILMNLAVNSRDAMPDGGRLTIDTANVDLDEHYASEHIDSCAGPHVMLAISDNGSGMDKETQSHVFEPFFTTKGQGKGTGLGLSTVYGIVKQSGGHVGLYSEPGIGTTFKVYLPRIESEADDLDSRIPQSDCPHGIETILLVEDEDSVRRLARTILESNGYTLVEAASADEARLILEQRDCPIDMMLTDVVMPGGGGREVAEYAATSLSEMKVLYMSGYTDDAIAHGGVLEAETPFLHKPFTRDALLRKVRQVLDKNKK